MRLHFLSAGLLLVAGCATRAPLPCAQVRTAAVLFATDRRQENPAKSGGTSGHGAASSLEFGPGRTEPPVLQLGWQEVTISPAHRLARLDDAVELAPSRVQKKTQHSLSHTDAEIQSFASNTVRQAIRAAPPPAPSGRREVLLFIHGYNDTFNYAVRKTAQLAADLELVPCEGKMRGVAIAYSWPAQGTFLSYLADEENAEWTQQRLVPFLRALSSVCREEGADLVIIAHSMGGRLLVRSLAEVASSDTGSARGPLAGQVVLLAPDIARDLFNQYAERMLPLVGHLTVYVSSKDHALELSSFLHGGHHRLGFVESTVETALNLTGLSTEDHRDLAGFSPAAAATGKIDMVDVTGGVADFVGHSYEDPAFIRDLRSLIYHHTPAGTGDRSNLQAKVIRPGLFGLLGQRLSYFELPNGSEQAGH